MGIYASQTSLESYFTVSLKYISKIQCKWVTDRTLPAITHQGKIHLNKCKKWKPYAKSKFTNFLKIHSYNLQIITPKYVNRLKLLQNLIGSTDSDQKMLAEKYFSPVLCRFWEYIVYTCITLTRTFISLSCQYSYGWREHLSPMTMLEKVTFKKDLCTNTNSHTNMFQ